jgi:uncharacterized protein (TIGR00645 family)
VQAMGDLKNTIYKFLMVSRWVLLVFYAGLAVALVAYAYAFIKKLGYFVFNVDHMDEIDGVLKVLGLIDATLVAGLILMVLLSGFGNFIGRPENSGDGEWLSLISFGALKTKFASTIAAISAINLLEVIFDIKNYTSDQVWMLGFLQLVLIVVVIVFAGVEKYSKHE